MSFLQPTLLLAALPLISLPIIIHLINQRRYQTVQWGAMMFLLAANRMSSGYARVRQYLILAARVLALAALALVLGRPLTGGWLGLTAGARADATILILDRSPSMDQAGTKSGASKLEAGRRQLVETLRMIGKSRWVLIDSASGKPHELDSVDALLAAPEATPTAAAADLPALLGAAREYIEANRAGLTDIWICSDLRENDWDPDGGRWQAVRDSYLELAQRARFHLLAYAQPPASNLAVRVTGIKRQATRDGIELLISLRVAREGTDGERATVPVQIEIEGARSEVAVELTGRDAELKDYRVVLGKGRGRGFGRVSIPADANAADNDYYFAFDQPKPRRSVVVVDNLDEAPPLQLAASIAPDPAIECSSEVVGPDALSGVEWEKVALLLWQAPVPTGEAAKLVQAFIDRGGRAIFFPPRVPTADAFLGVRWAGWVEAAQGVAVDGWRGDQDLLAQTQSGAPLAGRALAGEALLQASTGRRRPWQPSKGGRRSWRGRRRRGAGLYFCSTAADPASSSLATGGDRLLRPGPAGPGRRRGGPRSRPPARRGASWGGRPEDLEATRRRRRGPLHRLSGPAGGLRGRRAPPRRQPPGARRPGPRHRRGQGRRTVQGARLRPGRRLVGRRLLPRPGGLAAVPGGDDGGDGRRGGPLPAQARRSPGGSGPHERDPVASRSAHPLVGRPLGRRPDLDGGFCLVAWRRSGYRRAVGLLETDPVRLRRAWRRSCSTSPSGSRSSAPTRRRRSPSSTTPRRAWRPATSSGAATRRPPGHPARGGRAADAARDLEGARRQDPGRLPAVLPRGEGHGTDLNDPLSKAPDAIPNLRGVVLASDGDWNEGQPPVLAAARLRMKGVPVFAVPVGSPTRLPDIELLSLDAPTFGVAGKAVRIPFTIESAMPRAYATTVTLKTSDGDIADQGGQGRADGADQRRDHLEAARQGGLHARPGDPQAPGGVPGRQQRPQGADRDPRGEAPRPRGRVDAAVGVSLPPERPLARSRGSSCRASSSTRA